jgi:hypothetical protein
MFHLTIPSKMRRRAAFSAEEVLRRAFIGFLLMSDAEEGDAAVAAADCLGTGGGGGGRSGRAGRAIRKEGTLQLALPPSSSSSAASPTPDQAASVRTPAALAWSAPATSPGSRVALGSPRPDRICTTWLLLSDSDTLERKNLVRHLCNKPGTRFFWWVRTVDRPGSESRWECGSGSG